MPTQSHLDKDEVIEEFTKSTAYWLRKTLRERWWG